MLSTTRTLLFLIVIFLLTACSETPEVPAPPRSQKAATFGMKTSSMDVPITLPLDDIQSSLNRDIPKSLWSIDEYRSKCIPAQRIKLFKARLKILPDLGCRIIGQVDRGLISISGKGSRLIIKMPIAAKVSARDIGGFLKGETATANAVIRLDARLAVTDNWSPTANLAISYDWTEPPGIDFLGQRIRFANKVDPQLERIINEMEQSFRQKIAQIPLKKGIEAGWREGFAVIELNRERPPAWMRITPQGLAVPSYNISGRNLQIRVRALARTETIIGDRPATPEISPLPRPLKQRVSPGLNFSIPVLADYAQLEPVVLRALRRLARRGIYIDGLGAVDASFNQVTIYATEGDRLAVGVDVVAEIIGQRTLARFGRSRGRIWLTGKPVHSPNSQTIDIEDLRIYGAVDNKVGSLAVKVMGSEKVRHQMAAALTQNFTKDYLRVLNAARKAIARRQEGDFLISAKILKVEHGLVQPTADGLFLPVHVTGSASVKLSRKPR